MSNRTYISFDWAMKKMLRHKANFGILEGFLSELLGKDIKILNILESESNQKDIEDKFNVVDLKAQDQTGDIFIIEVQYSREVDYFHRMLFATAKANIEHLEKGYKYENIRKAYSINLLYFELGQGEDYIYHGKTSFIGIHEKDELKLSQAQKNRFLKHEVYEIYPEYYVIQINRFDDFAKNSLDEWIYFLKNSEVLDSFSAKGMDQVRNKMIYEKMSKKEKEAFDKHMLRKNTEKNILETARIEGLEEGIEKGIQKGLEQGREQGIEEGIEKGLVEGAKQANMRTACKMIEKGIDIQTIADITGLSKNDIENLDCN